MAKIQIPEYDIYYDDSTGLIYKNDNRICSNIPKGTFPFEGKLYTYGTRVRLKDRYVAEFKQDTEEKRTSSGYTIKMSEAKEYFDGKPFELDDIFAEVKGKRKVYNKYDYHFDNDIEKIVKPVYYTDYPTQEIVKEDPPVLNGYKMLIYEDKNNPLNNKYQDKLYDCNVDANGNVLTWFAPNTFGFGKYIYTIGTKVVMKYRDNIWRKNHFFVATFDGYHFVVDGYPQTHNKIEAKKFRSSTGGAGSYTILAIVEPHYYRPEGRNVTAWDKFKSGGGDAPVDTFHGTLWYIVIMVVGTIFKARIGIWVVSTIIYFLWKYGYLNKK